MTDGRDEIHSFGLVSGAVIAPLASVLIALLAAALPIVAGAEQAPSVGVLLGLVVVIALLTVWGFFPALAFGGLTLWLLTRLTRRPSTVVLAAAGVGAAGLYVAASLGLHAVNPQLAFLLAPWAGMITEESTVMALWPVLSILASGAPAGLIYASVRGKR